jgi:transcriptional regulator with XRE-family HTH domain
VPAPDEDLEAAIEEVGRRVAELRVAAKMTQAQVAEALGTTTPNYVRIEFGQNVTLKTIVRLAKILGVDRAELLTTPLAPKAPRKRGRPRKTPPSKS